MENFTVTIDGKVYSVPANKVANQEQAEAAVRRYIAKQSGVTEERSTRRPTSRSDLLAGLSQGATLGFADEIFGRLESLGGRTSAEDATARRRADVADARANSPLTTFGAEAIGSALPLAAAALASRGAAAPAVLQNALGRAAAIGALEGGIAGFGAGEGDAAQRLPSAALGGAVGGIAGGAGGVLAPKISEAGQRLMDAGMRMTPEMLGQPAQRTLNALQKIPSPFQARRDETLDAFNVVVGNEILKPIGKEIKDKAGREAYEAISKEISASYDDLLDPVTDINLGTYSAALTRANKAIGLPRGEVSGVRKELAELDKLLSGGRLTGKGFKEADSELRSMIENFRAQATNANLASEKNQGRRIANILEAVREDMFERAAKSVGGDFGERLRKTDFAYKLLQTLRKTVERAPGQGERFTPAQLLAGIKAVNRQTDQFAKGTAPLQSLAEDAQNVLGAVQYNSAADSAVLSQLGLNQQLLPLAGAVALGGYDQLNDGEMGRLTQGAGALGLLSILGQRPVYNRLAPTAVALGRPAGRLLSNTAPFLGLQAGRAFNEDQR